MLTLRSRRPRQDCGGVSRRDFLRVGALSVGSLTLGDVLRQQGQASSQTPRGKSIIMVFLGGGPSHLDTYDMKPRAAEEFRGEFKSIASQVPGMDVCELMPRQAQIMDKLTILRGMSFIEEHDAHNLWTGYPRAVKRPALGAVVSYLKGDQFGLPPSVSLLNDSLSEDPAYCGPAHRPFMPNGPGLEDLRLVEAVSTDRLSDRKRLLQRLDTLRREIDYAGTFAGVDAHRLRALEIITSPDGRAAFDIDKEPASVRDRYGKANEDFLRARRCVEAGISVVTLGVAVPEWDTHFHNFETLRRLLPQLDQGLHALITDLCERGMLPDVAVVVWGEFGRAPRINSAAGRDHWPKAGCAVLAGGNFKAGQVLGGTDARGEEPRNAPVTTSHVLTSLYQHMGIDPSLTIVDHNGRPTPLLDNRDPVPGLV